MPIKQNVAFDPAEGAGRLARPRPVRVVAVTSGKGGVGKTNVAVNLAMAMAARGKQTMLLDADLALAGVDMLLGLTPTYNLAHVVNGECALEEVIVDGANGLKIIPAASGIKRMADLSPAEHGGLISAFDELGRNLDVLVVDTAAGIADSVTSFARACQEVIVVVCDEPASISGAYALIKVLSRDRGQSRVHILANMAQTPNDGRALYGKLARESERSLDVTLDYMGSVPYDEYLRKAVQKQRAVVEAYPNSKSATAFGKLAAVADKWPIAQVAAGHVQFFFERMLQAQDAEVRAWV